MDNLSNKTLVVLLAASILLTAFGTTTILSKLGSNPFPAITGAASTVEGNVSVTVAAVTSIRIVGSNVSFGNGSAFGGVVLSTAEGTDNPSTFNDPSGGEADDFVIENDGNVDVNLTVNGSSATDFITTGTSPAYNFSSVNITPDDGCNGGTQNLSEIPFGVGSVTPSICENFTFRDFNDTMNITINLFLPADVEPSTYVDTNVLFSATAV